MPKPRMLRTLTVNFFAGLGAAMAIETGPLNLSGNQYWGFPLDHVGDIGIERLNAEQQGMLIDAPLRIFSDEHRKIPLVCLRTQSKERAREVSLALTTKVILSHLETGDVQLVDLQRRPDIRDSRSPSKGWANEWYVADLKEIADFGPSLGRYAVWLVCGPEESNTVQFQIFPNRKSESSGDIRERIKELRIGKSDEYPTIRTLPPFISAGSDSPSESNPATWSLTKYGNEKDGIVLKLIFDITGLPRFLPPSGKFNGDQEGKSVKGMIPVLLVGFTKEHGLAYLEKIHLPVLNAPKGPDDAPRIYGEARIAMHKNPNFDAKLVSYVWAIAMNHRSLVRL